MDKETFISMALSFQGVEQKAHFDRIGFKAKGKRMFATYLSKNHTANIFLRPEEQKLFCEMNKMDIYPVPNKWGEKGATTFDLNNVTKEWVLEALLSAYNDTLKPKK